MITFNDLLDACSELMEYKQVQGAAYTKDVVSEKESVQNSTAR